MPYIGKSPSFGVRNRFVYVASSGATSVSGADANGATLTFTDGAFVDVYLNGVLLKPTTDYNTTTANTIAGLSALNTSDEVTVVVYDVFAVADTVSATSGGTFSGNVTFNGDISVGDDVSLASDGAVLSFGADSEITLTHRHNDGLILKHTGTGSGSRPALAFHAGETAIEQNDVLGKIEFQAPDESSGSDAILIGAEIRAVAELDFTSSVNETRLEFRTGNSEAATTKMSIDGDGGVGIGTTAPDDQLHVVGLARITSTAGTGCFLRFDNTPNTNGKIYRAGDGISAHGAFDIYNQSDNLFPFTISAEGRIALGIDASPNASAMVRCDTNESDEQAFTIHASHASFATEAMNIFSTRTGSTDFSFLKMHSNSNNDVEFNFKGEGTVNSDGTNNLGSGADYAEYFEWKDGNSSSEDRVGYSVILDDNQIVKATSSDDTSKIVGVISGNPAVVGDTAWNKWSKKHLKDDYGRYIMEEYSITEWYESDDNQKTLIQYMTDEIPSDVKIPSDATVISTEVDGKTKLKRRKVNPDWDKSKTYIPREDRKEWDIVGLTGKLRLRKGQPTGDRWIKMRDISDTVEEWLVR
jgi:hypothetical protein